MNYKEELHRSRKMISWSKSVFLKLLKTTFVALMIMTTMSPNALFASDTTSEQDYFVIEKKWQNDLVSERPSKIYVDIASEDSPTTVIQTVELTADNNWKKEVTIDSTSANVTYLAKERVVGESDVAKMQKYIETSSSPLTIVSNKSSSTVHTGDTYTINTSAGGVDAAPIGDIIISGNLSLDSAIISYTDQKFEVETCGVYYTDGSLVNNGPRIVYKGELATGVNEVGNITLRWEDKASSRKTGELYDLEITLSNIVIYSLINTDAESPRYVSVLYYEHNQSQPNKSMLHLQAYSGGLYDSNDLKKSIVGVETEVTFKVLDQQGNGVDGFTQFYAQDLDIADYLAGVYNGDIKSYDTSARRNYYGNLYTPVPGGKRFVESVEFNSRIGSDIYFENNSILSSSSTINPESIKIFPISTPTIDPRDSTIYSDRKSLKCLVPTNPGADETTFVWRGSNCGTAIIPSGNDLAPYPENIITNSSSLYKVQYFYQLEGIDASDNKYVYYSDIPNDESELIQVAPSTEVTVTEDVDKVPSADRGMPATGTYVLDTAENAKWSGTTSAEASKNPLILKVYFKKVYRVTYHDSLNDSLWNATDDQTSNGIPFGNATPDFKGDVTTKNPGYEFVGWSKEKGGEIIEVPEDVTEDADYWANWRGAVNKYIVHYFYEENGSYPDKPNFVSEIRKDKRTDEIAEIIETDKIPDPSKPNHFLNEGMKRWWSGVVVPDGSLVLKVYFSERKKEGPSTYIIPVTGIEK